MEQITHSRFLWKSVNLHGIHSPFVFGIAGKYFYGKYYPRPEKALLKNIKNISQGEIQTLYRIAAAIKPAKIYVLGDNADEATEVIRMAAEAVSARPWFFSPLAPIPGSLDIAYIRSGSVQELQDMFRQASANCSETTPVIVGGIHTSVKAQAAWESLKQHPDATVFIDAYHLGLVFLRKGSVKQEFFIRPKSSFMLNAVLGIRNLWGLLA